MLGNILNATEHCISCTVYNLSMPICYWKQYDTRYGKQEWTTTKHFTVDISSFKTHLKTQKRSILFVDLPASRDENPFRWNRLIFTRHEFTLLHASLRVCYGKALLLCESYRPFSNRRLYCVILSKCYARQHKHTGKKIKLPCDETNVKKQGTPKNILDSSTGFSLRECLLWSSCLQSPR